MEQAAASCQHTNEQIIICIYPGCQAADMAACRRCMVKAHRHGLFVPHQKAIRRQLQPVVNFIEKRKQLRKTIKDKFERERETFLSKLLEQEQQWLSRLEGMLDSNMAVSISEINSGKLTNRQLVKTIMEGKLQLTSRLYDNLNQFENQFNGKQRQNIPIAVEQIKEECLQVEPQKKFHRDNKPNAAVLTQKQVELLQTLERLEEDIQELVQHNVVAERQPSNEDEQEMRELQQIREQMEKQVNGSSTAHPQEIPQRSIKPAKDEPTLTIPDEPAHIEPFVDQVVPRSEGSTDSQPLCLRIHRFSQIMDPSFPSTYPSKLQVIIDFHSVNSTIRNYYNQHRANISDFMEWLKKLEDIEELSISIGQQCQMYKWNLAQIEDNLKSLQKIKKFTLSYYPSNRQSEQFPFAKLKDRQVEVVKQAKSHTIQ